MAGNKRKLNYVPAAGFKTSKKLESSKTAVKVGDVCFLRPPDDKTQPYIAKIEKIEGKVMKVRWYYRPEDAAGGRRAFHGEKEIFLSDHVDEVSLESVIQKIKVHDFKTYIKLPMVGPDDFFSRFEYKATLQTFSPDRVAVFCKCEMPYNPDDLMMQCSGCKDWFHPQCVGLQENSEQIKRIDYKCDACIKKRPR